MTAARYDVTDLVLARRRTRPPTWLFVSGLVIGWVLDIAAIVLVVRADLGVLVAIGVGVVGYLLLPVPAVVVLRETWLRTHRDRAVELERQLGDHVPAFRAWVDERVGEPVGLPPELAVTWLLRPEPAAVNELLALPQEPGWRVGGTALAARHEIADGHTEVRLAVLSDATTLTDGPEPPPA